MNVKASVCHIAMNWYFRIEINILTLELKTRSLKHVNAFFDIRMSRRQGYGT